MGFFDRVRNHSDDTWPAERPQRAELWTIAALVALAFVLRLVYVLDLRASPYFEAPILDAAYHVDWARSLAAGHTFEQGPFFRAPLYPWLLGGLFDLLGPGLFAVRVVQCLLGAATTLLTWMVGRRAFDPRVGLLAAAGAATYWVLIYFDGEFLIPTLAVPLNLWALWLTLGLAREARPWPAWGAGLAWGLATIARPNVLALAPVLALWLLAGARAARGRAAGSLAAGSLAAGSRATAGVPLVLALAVGWLMPVLPITAYNFFVGGDAALVSTQAGVNLWIGNNPESDGHSAHVPGTRDDFWGTYHDAAALAALEAGRELSPSAVSRHYTAKALAFVFGRPAESLPHLARKVGLLLRDDELGNNQPVRFFAMHFSRVTRWSPLGFSLLAPLGLLGLALSLRRRLLPLWGFVSVYGACVVAFFVCSRFRVPLLPPLLVLGAHAVFWAMDAWRAGRRRAVGGWALALATGVVLSLATRPDPRQAEVAGLRFLATGYGLAGDHARAAPLFERALYLDPQDPLTLTAHADHLEDVGRSAAALRSMESALRLAPWNERTLDRLFGMLLRRGQPQDLLDLEQRAAAVVAARPRLATAQYHLGVALLRQQRSRRAAGPLAQAQRLEPRGSRVYVALSILAARRGDPSGELGHLVTAADNARFENASRMQASVYGRLVPLALELEQPGVALLHARRFLELHPDSSPARDL
ncbi:MAG: glycosyltransferase family 39 protein, partial [Planctomycetota bacterium]